VAPPRLPPAGVGRLVGKVAASLARSQRIATGRFQAATGWAPTRPSVREGWPPVVAALVAAGE